MEWEGGCDGRHVLYMCVQRETETRVFLRNAIDGPIGHDGYGWMDGHERREKQMEWNVP